MTESSQRPVKNLHLGYIRAAVWHKQGQHGAFYEVTFGRSYKDADQNWQTAHSFGLDDLLKLSKLADQAHTYVGDLMRADREEQRREEESSDGDSPDPEEGRRASRPQDHRQSRPRQVRDARNGGR